MESQSEGIIASWDDKRSSDAIDRKIPDTLDKLHVVTGELEGLFVVAHWARVTSLANLATTPFFFTLNNEFHVLADHLRVFQNRIRLFSESIVIMNSMTDIYFDSIAKDQKFFESLMLRADDLSKGFDELIRNNELINASFSKSLDDPLRISILFGFGVTQDIWITPHKDLSIVSEFSNDVLENAESLIHLFTVFSSITHDLKSGDRIYKDDVRKVNGLFVDLIGKSASLSQSSMNLDDGEWFRLSSQNVQSFNNIALLLHELSMIGHLSAELLVEEFDETYGVRDEYFYLTDAQFISEYLANIYKENTDFVSHFRNLEMRLEYLSEDVEDFYSRSNYSASNFDLESSIRYVDTARLLVESIPIFRHFLEDEIRQYLLLSHSVDELRPTGGFVSGLWLLTLKAGNIEQLRYYDIVDVDDMGMIDNYPEVPDLLRMYMGAGIWLMRDVSWGPDIETTAEAARKMFEISTKQRIDGVIGVNQRVLFNVVESLGVLEVSEGDNRNVEAREVISYIEKRSDESGRVFADSVLRSILIQLLENRSMEGMLSIGDSVKRSVDSNDLWIYLFDDEVQTILEELDLYPVLHRSSEGDYLFIIDSNIGWSKSDSNIQRNFSYKIDLRNFYRPLAELRLHYKNFSGNTAAECEPQWIDRGETYSQLKNACYWDLVRVFIPMGTELIQSSMFELPPLSIPTEKWGYPAGHDSANKGSFNDDLDQFSGLIVIAPGESITKTLIYELPGDVVHLNGNCASYSLELKKQPGIAGRLGEIEILLPSDYLVSDHSDGLEILNDRISISSFIDKDSDIFLNFLKNESIDC